MIFCKKASIYHEMMEKCDFLDAVSFTRLDILFNHVLI